MEQHSTNAVVFGRKMRKYRPSLIQDDTEPHTAGETVGTKEVAAASPVSKTLLEQTHEAKRNPDAPQAAQEPVGVDKRLLMSALASTRRETPVLTGWTPYSYVASVAVDIMGDIRRQLHIIVEGEDIPPAILSFKDMRLPPALCDYLTEVKGITEPSLIQMQGISAALAGRDMIGIASTGSGKTLAFCIPLVLFALEAEMKLEIVAGEGPVCMILAPSRELARQTHQQCCELADHLAEHGFPHLRIVNLIGGLPMGEQITQINKGMHVVVGTPGRMLDLLKKGHLHMHSCRHMCLDEADRMIDLGFEEELRGILSHCKHKAQMMLFSATMPNSIKDFAMKALDNPVLINVGRAGAANLDIVQEVELVERGKRLDAILDALQKTAPPVIIFASGKSEVDDVLEFLLLKEIEAVAIHGGKTQEERIYAIDSFRAKKKDVLVATDIASKGLDLPNIQHIINYDMPSEIEDYVHRIGRTGRGGCTGIATTFVDPTTCSEAVMLDLKLLLTEAQQNVPPFLAKLQDIAPNAHPCSICGGLGHSIDKCPKIGAMASKQLSTMRGDGPGAEY